MSAEDDYDPHLLRMIPEPINNCEALIAILKSTIGTGVLAIPMAYSDSGWLLGLISTCIIGIVITYALHVLLHGMYETSKRHRIPDITYSEAMSFAVQDGPPIVRWMSNCSEIAVDLFLALYHFGILAVYVLFMANNMKEVMDIYVSEMDSRIYMCILLVPLIIIFGIRDIKHLVPFAFIANVLLFIGFGFVFYYVFQGLPPLSERTKVQELSRYPLFFGTSLFAMESVGVIVAIEANMKTPKSYLGYTGILNIGMFSVLVLYAGFGFFGYWRYGDDIKGSITLNIPSEDVAPQIIKMLFVVAIYMTYSLQGYVVIDVIWHHYLARRFDSNLLCWEYLLRAFVVTLSILVAVVTTDLGTLISLVGAFCLSFLGLMFPAMIDISIRYKVGYGTFKIYLLQDIFIFVFGAVGGAVGSWVAIKELIAANSA